MKFSTTICALACAAGAIARSPQHVGRNLARYTDASVRREQRQREVMGSMTSRPERRSKSKHADCDVKRFEVDGTSLPEVDFDIGESYAGTLPLTHDKDEDREMFFWYFPSVNEAADKEILIWLNGGPGCSSLEGLFQENGPVLWQYGTLKPFPNPWSWHNLTNVVWVEQPVGTGFSTGKVTAKTEADVADQFLQWWQVFMDTFDMTGYKVYIAGESYAGMYVPHIADAMFAKNDTKYYDLQSILIYDPSINNDAIMGSVPAPAFTRYWEHLFPFNDTFKDHLESVDKECGLTKYIDDNLKYPPKGQLPDPPSSDKCLGVFEEIIDAVMLVNPCWDIYQVATTCPLLYDILGFPGSFTYLPPGGQIYFDRKDVKKALNAPVDVKWSSCSEQRVFLTPNGLSKDANDGVYSSTSVLPGVIEKTKRTIIAHGQLDYILMTNGTLLTIQNMTWNGAQGFQHPIKNDFYIPPHPSYQDLTLAASGIMGKTHTERGLTFVDINLSGHMVPQYQPSAAYRHLEYLLGRIPSLSSRVPFTKSDAGLIGQPDEEQ